MNHSTHSGRHRRHLLILIGLIIVISFSVSSGYRGIAHDEGLRFGEIAVNVLHHQPVFDPEHEIGDSKKPTRLLYILFIALGYKLCGVTLFALHLFPYLIQIFNPALFFSLLYRRYRNIWWSAAGALAFIFLPFNLTYLNQQHNHPIFMCILLCMALLLTTSLRPPVFWGILGVLSSLLILTRFEDGVMYVAAMYLAGVMKKRKRRMHVGWVVASLGIIVIGYAAAALIFQFPLSSYWLYIPEVLTRQHSYSGGSTFYDLTKAALRIMLNWYFMGKILAPVLALLLVVGTVKSMKQREFSPLVLFYPHFFFILLIYNGRYSVIDVPVITFTTPGFILLTLTGMMSLSAVLARQINLSGVRWKILGGLLLAGTLGLWGRSVYSLAMVIEDAQPASTIWHILKANPLLPGHPDYQPPLIRLTKEGEAITSQTDDRLARESLYHAVRTVYRPWMLHRIGEYAFDLGLPEKARQHADLVFVADYASENAWQQRVAEKDGDSAFWSPNYPGRIGAFPHGTHGTVIYKFDAAHPIDAVTISGLYAQWGVGDRMKMWTSADGKTWTLRYGGWNARFTQDVYYQFFDEEFEGASALYVKYYFRAGDIMRAADDNRGASLAQLQVAITYRK